MDTSFQRARSSEAKLQREMAIFDAARLLAGQHGVREVTLSDIAGAVGMHKSALLRYFETREQIFLILTAEEWRAWSNIVQEALVTLKPAAPASVAAVLANSLTLHPLFCDLLAQAPMNLERNVSIQAVRSFKLVVLHEVRAVASALERLLGINAQQALDALTTATSMAGALWQMATPGNEVRTLYRSDPQLAHAVVDVGPRLTHILEGLLAGYVADTGQGQTSALA